MSTKRLCECWGILLVESLVGGASREIQHMDFAGKRGATTVLPSDEKAAVEIPPSA
jgi:hypothetical protein